MDRKMIQMTHTFSEFRLEGTIESVMAQLGEWKSAYGDTAMLEPSGYDGEWEIRYERPETDAEYEKRMARAERNKEANAKRKATLALQKKLAANAAAVQEKKLYERLKAKYEGK